MTIWIHRLFILVPASEIENANAGHALYWPGGDAERFTFSVPLSLNGTQPATHHGCNTAATESLWQMWRAMQGQGIGSGAVWYRLSVDAGILLETNSLSAETGRPFSWRDALADNSLKLIKEE